MKSPLKNAVAALAASLMLLALHSPLQAWEPVANELDATIVSGDFTAYFAHLSGWLAQKTPSDPAKITEAAMTDLLKDPILHNALDQREFLAAHGIDKVSAFAKAEARRPFLAWVLKSATMMDMYLEAVASTAGEIGDGSIDIGALERWHKLYAEDPESRDGVYLKLAMASALWPPGGGCTYRAETRDWLKRYHHYKDAHKNKELVASFDHLIVHDYGQVISSTAADQDLAWGRKMVQTWRPDLLEKEQIHKIVSEVWRRASPIPFDNGYVTVMEGGGKCGPRGAFGCFICQAFGIPAITVGQPAHYCFAARCDYPETDPQRGSVWKVYQGRGWQVSDCGVHGSVYVAEMTKRYRTAELSLIAHLNWLAAAISPKPPTAVAASFPKADALRALAVKARKPVNTSQPLAVPSDQVDVVLAGRRISPALAATMSAKEVEPDYNKESAAPVNGVSSPVAPPKVPEAPIQVPPGVIHVKIETFTAKSPDASVYDCYTGGKQVNFPKTNSDTHPQTWLDYATEAPQAGVYALEVMVATANRDQALDVSRGSEKLGTVRIAGTKGLWQKVGPVDIKLEKGKQILRISAPAQRGVAIRWFELTPKK